MDRNIFVNISLYIQYINEKSMSDIDKGEQ